MHSFHKPLNTFFLTLNIIIINTRVFPGFSDIFRPRPPSLHFLLGKFLNVHDPQTLICIFVLLLNLLITKVSRSPCFMHCIHDIQVKPTQPVGATGQHAFGLKVYMCLLICAQAGQTELPRYLSCYFDTSTLLTD